MNKKIKNAFDSIHAEDELKIKTKTFLLSNAQSNRQRKTLSYRRLVPVLACFLLLLTGFGFGGCYLYFTPSASISIDVNPSIELGVNRFDRVVSIDGYNEDGQAFADSLEVKFLHYEKAVRKILADSLIDTLLSQDEFLSITVVGPDEKQCGRILSDMEHCTGSHKNTSCHSVTSDEVNAAHEAGLSYGKYKAYLDLHRLCPDLTPEDIRNMTMKEIRDLLNTLPSENSDTNENNETQDTGHGRHGHGHGHN